MALRGVHRPVCHHGLAMLGRHLAACHHRLALLGGHRVAPGGHHRAAAAAPHHGAVATAHHPAVHHAAAHQGAAHPEHPGGGGGKGNRRKGGNRHGCPNEGKGSPARELHAYPQAIMGVQEHKEPRRKALKAFARRCKRSGSGLPLKYYGSVADRVRSRTRFVIPSRSLTISPFASSRSSSRVTLDRENPSRVPMSFWSAAPPFSLISRKSRRSSRSRSLKVTASSSLTGTGGTGAADCRTVCGASAGEGAVDAGGPSGAPSAGAVRRPSIPPRRSANAAATTPAASSVTTTRTALQPPPSGPCPI